ncbi:hypothetical protein AB0I81_57355 [Nonomuraea sp. NPDC050404]|uniref:hypothetical protein n=1 Tax=Nonomuraea sp. NPDC050404 TaxID=3155783 RepID=UPI0033CA10D7
MFFEPLPEQDDAPGAAEPELPAWTAPPTDETGVVVPTGLMLARTPHVAIALPMVRSFRTGCLMEVEVILRQGELSSDAFSDLQAGVYPTPFSRRFPPNRMLRIGVRYADGGKAGTLIRNGERVRIGPEGRPVGPLLSWQPTGDQLHGAAPYLGHNRLKLWLWPLPPAETFELGVEWPIGGVEPSVVELDGAAFVAAAQRSDPYWPAPG